jgi:hypothetical protein
MVARKRSGSSWSFWILSAFLFPLFTRCRTRLLRSEINEISAAAKKPFRRMRSMIERSVRKSIDIY